MKKTIIALFALAGAAMGITLEDFTEYTVAESVTIIDPTSNAITVALTLDVDTIKGYFSEASGSHLILDVEANNSIGFGTLVKNGKEYWSGAWAETVDYAMTGAHEDMAANSAGGPDLWTNAKVASLVFSADRTSGARVVFTLGYEDGTTWQTVGTAGGVKSANWDPSGTLTLDTSAVKSLATYEGYITEDEAKAIGSAMVPEPTTATLSLLALAGLAARRRRK